MQIFIKNDRTIVVDIDQDASTDDLREIILMKFGYPSNTYYMTYSGKIIGKGKISEYRITKDSTVFVSLRLNYNTNPENLLE